MNPRCRLCAAELTETFVDLGMSPPCESFLAADQLDRGETFYPLHVRICSQCLLVQLPAYIAAEDIFSHYAYFSSFSDSWVAHAGRYVDAAVERLGLGADSFVVEVASNDGYLLQHVVARGIRALGIEPAANVAEAAVAKGMPHRGAVPRRGDRRRGGRPARPGRPGGGQQRVRPRARHRRLRQGPAGAGRGRRPSDDRDPAPAAAHRGPPVRHDLPRALLVPVAAHDPAGPGRRGADRGRRRGAAHPRRLAADVVRAGRDGAGAVARRGRGPGRGVRGRARHARGSRRVRGRRRRGAQRPGGLPGGTVARRATWSPATGRPGRATRCSTTRASGPTCWPSRSTATRSSTASSCPARTSRSSTSTRSRPGSPTSWSSCRGTCGPRSRRSSPTSATGAGGSSCRCPRLEVLP